MKPIRVLLTILDSVGVGELPDAAKYGDVGSNTLGNISKAVGGLKMPNMGRLGLGNIIDIQGIPPEKGSLASFGRMAQKSAGKDTTTGHWELAGIIIDKPFPVYPWGFPIEIISSFENKIGRPTIGNKVASGTEIIEELGASHLETGHPIVYTSADSVFQIAAHEEVISIDELYNYCKTARRILQGDHAVARVIARPFIGKPGGFIRTERRRDFSLKPPSKTVLQYLIDKIIPVYAVGKVEDIFAGEGITHSYLTKGNSETVDKIIELLNHDINGLIIANLVDFDMLYGHRNNVQGYARALEKFDSRMPELINHMRLNDILIITADHGCDPTTLSTDHSREYVPLLIYGDSVRGGINLGERETFADVSATIAQVFGFIFPVGQSFWPEVKKL